MFTRLVDLGFDPQQLSVEGRVILLKVAELEADRNPLRSPENKYHTRISPCPPTESQPIFEAESTTYKESLGTVVYTHSFPE